MRGRARRLAAALLAAGVLAGCTAVPDHGPVVTVGDATGVSAAEPPDIVPASPQPGETRSDIVKHFLEAMRASPIDTTVAKKFLTKDAAAAWQPERETITYVSLSGPVGGSSLKVRLLDTAHYDARGSFQGELPRSRRTLDFPMTFEDGEWRISEAPNALIVNDSWFAQRFERVSVYFFDTGGRYLIPEPVFLPQGARLPTALTQSLLAGPPPGLANVERSYVPSGTTLELAVPPVSGPGLAEISLTSGAELNEESRALMVAQLAWTLRQVPGVRALHLTLDGQPVSLPAGGREIPAEFGLDYDPTGYVASAVPFGLQGGRLVSDAIAAPRPVQGPFGTRRSGLRSVAIDPSNVRVAGVTRNGQTILETSVGNSEADVVPVVSGGQDLLQPSWDLSGRLWVVDRRESGAAVGVVSRGGSPRPVRAPGIAGREVRAFEVSRDGSRFVAVLAGRAGDTVVVSRIERLPGGLRLTRAVPIRWSDSAGRIRDIGWSDPTTAAALVPLTEDIYEVTTLPLDGSPGRSITTGGGDQRWLVSSPVGSEPTYVLTRDSAAELADLGTLRDLAGVDPRTLTYVG